MAHRFRVQMWDDDGNYIDGLSASTMRVVISINHIELHVLMTHQYKTLPEIMADAMALTVLVELLDGKAEQKVLRGFKRRVRVQDAEITLDYGMDEPVRMVYTLETINTNLEESEQCQPLA